MRSGPPIPPTLADLAARGLVSSGAGAVSPPDAQADGKHGARGGDASRQAPVDTLRAREVRAEADGPTVDKAVTKAVAAILRSTASRPITEAEAIEVLQGHDHPPDVIAAAIAEARRQRAIDDLTFCRMWVEDRGLRRGFGAARLRRELRRRKAHPAAIDAALTVLDDRDDEAAAEELARARLGALPAPLEPAAVARRLVAYLVRRGHHPALAERVAIRVSGLDRQWD
ncbi:MAG: RecX family transcriptional regulator [Egibacteraceae bacterium]